MYRLGIILLGVANLISATVPMGIVMLFFVSFIHEGFYLVNMLIVLLMFILEAVKWVAFYHIIKNNNMRWFSYFIVYNILIITISINNPLFFTVVAAYIIAYLVLNQVQKNGQKAALS